MNQAIYDKAVEFVTKILNDIQPSLDVESFNGINHYLIHSEIEMAFEGMFIEIMSRNLTIEADHGTIIKIASELNLDKETVFDANFWNKLENYNW